MDIKEGGHPQKCLYYQTLGHTRNYYPHN